MPASRSLIAWALLAAAAASAQPVHVNVTAGGPLRPGVYGRIEVKGKPPPLISPVPVIASQVLGPVRGTPVYWYLPPGQVRKWRTACRKYAACDVPVYFVRMDDNPGRLGLWKKRLRDAVRAESARDAGGGAS